MVVECGACLTDSGTAGSELHIVSGGDDCSAAYNIISSSQTTVSTSLRKVDAHSSSIKGTLDALHSPKLDAELNGSAGIKFYGVHTFVTTSTDQRLTAWTVLANNTEERSIQRVASIVTSVTDVSDLAILEAANNDQAALVTVVGIGLQMLRIRT